MYNISALIGSALVHLSIRIALNDKLHIRLSWPHRRGVWLLLFIVTTSVSWTVPIYNDLLAENQITVFLCPILYLTFPIYRGEWPRQISQQRLVVKCQISKWIHLYSAISHKRISIALGALVSREQDLLQCACKDTVAHRRFTQFDRQWIPEGRTLDSEGPPAECATSIPLNDQAVQVGWSSMSTGDVGDWSAAVDQIPWCFVLRTLTDHDIQLVLIKLGLEWRGDLKVHGRLWTVGLAVWFTDRRAECCIIDERAFTNKCVPWLVNGYKLTESTPCHCTTDLGL